MVIYRRYTHFSDLGHEKQVLGHTSRRVVDGGKVVLLGMLLYAYMQTQIFRVSTESTPFAQWIKHL